MFPIFYSLLFSLRVWFRSKVKLQLEIILSMANSKYPRNSVVHGLRYHSKRRNPRTQI